MDLLKSENDENVTFEFSEACIRGDLDKVTNLLSRKEEIDVKQLDKYFTLQRVVMHFVTKVGLFCLGHLKI